MDKEDLWACSCSPGVLAENNRGDLSLEVPALLSGYQLLVGVIIIRRHTIMLLLNVNLFFSSQTLQLMCLRTFCCWGKG